MGKRCRRIDVIILSVVEFLTIILKGAFAKTHRMAQAAWATRPTDEIKLGKNSWMRVSSIAF
jgi:hypothetical protein